MIAALVYFLVVMFAMGFAAWRLLGLEEEDDCARIFLWLATGILVFVLASTVLGFVGQANWIAYLLLAAILLAAAYWKGGMKLRMPEVSRDWTLVCLLFVVTLAVYVAGSFAYPWLEDDDPWDHAAGVHYVSLFGSYIQPTDLPLHYLAPYTPFYDLLMGVLFQFDGSSMQVILRFFNAFLISLSIPLFFCWAKERLGSRNALWAAFALAMLPCFMSHFIWAQTLSMMLVFPALYFIEKSAKAGNDAAAGKLRNGFGILAVLSVAAVCITQPSTAAMFCGLLAMYIAALALTDLSASRTINIAKIRPPLTALLGGLLLSIVLYWGPMFAMYPVGVLLPHIGLSAGLLTSPTQDTSGGVVYGLGDFIDAPTASKIDQPTGFGPAMALFLVIGIIAACFALRSTETRDTAAMALLWLVYCLIGTEGNLLPVKLFPHRFWVFLAIPVAILAGYGIVKVLEYVEKNRKGLDLVAKVVIIVALLCTSAYPKSVVETAQWPPGTSWASDEQLAGYVKLETLPANTKVFDFCMRDEFADGVDMAGYQWVKEVSDYKAQSINDSLDGNYAFLKRYGYEYAIIDQSCLKTFTADQVNAKVMALNGDGRFTLVQQLSSGAFITLKVN